MDEMAYAAAPLPRYALVTPARNEEAQIWRALESGVRQTHQPVKWIIVNDNSSDRTGQIIQSYAARFDYIEYLSAQPGTQANFGSKIKAFNAGYAHLAGVQYDFVGNLDADVSFEPDYFARLLGRMRANPQIGLGGGIILELYGGRFVAQTISLDSVAGAVQMFRREVFESIGGFVPLELGGEDSAAEIMTRMKGWRTQTFSDLHVGHHGRVTMGGRNVLVTHFNKGRVNYTLGYHPVFQLGVGVYRMRHRPFFIGGILMNAGYLCACLRRTPRKIPTSVVEYVRGEQMQRLARLLVPWRRVQG